MKQNIRLGVIIAALVLIAVSAYLFTCSENSYKITSQVNYGAEKCDSISDDGILDGFNTGVRLVLKDKLTGEILDGYSDRVGVSGYSCLENTKSESTKLTAYSKGYAPLVFDLKYVKNKMITIEVYMAKSCSEHSVPDKIPEDVYNLIKEHFGLEKGDFTLSCLETNMERGGYIKAKGTYKDGTPLDLYYNWGWCSSGGSGCGWNLCFSSTNNNLFEAVRNTSCGQVIDAQYNNDGCDWESQDKTILTYNKCNNGDFENLVGSKRTLAIRETLSRCEATARAGEFNCLNY